MSISKRQPSRWLLGQRGEALAADFLRQKEYQILRRNYRCGREEIDLIAFDKQNQEIVFCEVKTRSNDDLAEPEIGLTARKLQAQIAAAKKYLRQYPSHYDYRFDLITVLPDVINHYENVTWP